MYIFNIFNKHENYNLSCQGSNDFTHMHLCQGTHQTMPPKKTEVYGLDHISNK